MLQFTRSKVLIAAADLEVAAPAAPVDVEDAVWDAVAEAELDVDRSSNGDITYQAKQTVLNGIQKFQTQE
jgi:hypothetical protein